MKATNMAGVKIGLLALTLTMVVIGTTGVYASAPPPTPQLVAPSDGTLFTIEQITLEWDTVPHDKGYYWFSWSRSEDPDWWIGPNNNRVQGTEYVFTKSYVQSMVYNGHSDTFYWKVVAEIDPGYYWPESWSHDSAYWSFNVLKWPAAWIDEDYWEVYTSDAADSVKSVDGQMYTRLLSWGSPDTGWWEAVGSGQVPITISRSVHLCWTDRSSDEQPKAVPYADYYRLQIATSASFGDIVWEATSETISYDTPELPTGAYYWRVRSETHEGLATDWNSPRKFIIATAPSTISCSVSSDAVAVGSPVTVSGSITPAVSGATVTMGYMTDYYSSSRPLTALGTATTGADGGFTYSWTPGSPGEYYIVASWEGDSSFGGATSDFAMVTAKSPTSITCSASPSEVNSGSSVKVTATLSPAVSSVSALDLTFEKPDGTTFIHIANLESDGIYVYSFKPDVVGSWTVSASWDGNNAYMGASSSPSSFTVKKSGCFIATATYGSELSPQVQFLREFRDNTVSSTFAGANFMTAFNAFYYSFSPGVAATISGNEALRGAMKIVLYPLIGILQLSSLIFPNFSFSPELGVVVTGLVASSLIAVVYVAPWVLLVGFLRKLRLPEKAIRSVGLIWAGDVVALAVAAVASSPLLMMATSGAFVVLTMCLATLVTAKAVMEHYRGFY